ncbi:ATP-binding cassette domain-containing protein [Synechococcus sp. CS-1328]|uniref:ATP-binding cassette domain-containing protein n=1 Tax=Synechococcus sp. CS-1328 TaxID=2847976 RepID=UPI00223C4740|nr:ATP-binding cassette domain-containing protein [Synechococcus sp. CS-1328]MCT0225250.1 ATP-binding cassette domain-containing protein [Synechococcus sp. CS-1328]
MLELLDIAVTGRVVAGVTRPRLQGVTLRLQPGDTVALLGASGAGKSTLLAVANGLLEPTRGAVVWQGEARARSGRRRRRQQARIGTLWQDLRLIEELSVQQNLNAARLAAWGWPRALLNLLLPLETEANVQALRQVDLDPGLLGEPVAALSGGQRQRVALARLLRQEPTLLLADEPLASLDPRLAQDLLALLLAQAEPPRALLLSLHRPDLIGGFSRVVGLRQGRVVVDAPPSAISPQDLKALYASEPQVGEPQ